MAEPSDIAALYERYGPTLYRRCKSLVGNEDDARDLVQEAFVRFLKAGYDQREDKQEENRAFALLYRISTNLSIDRLRGRGRGQHDDADDHVLRAPGDMRATVASGLDFARLTQGLKERYVTVAVLYHVDGYTQEEIAESMGLSRKSVGKTLARVEKHLKQRGARLGYAQEGAVHG